MCFFRIKDSFMVTLYKMTDKIAVIIPCYNEEVAIPDVIKAFRKELPKAEIYVYDNNSKDKTIEVAKKAGAIVRSEYGQGKGNVVRRMFADIDADIYVMIDGDHTYHAPSVNKLINKLKDENLDMVVGCRKATEQESYRSGHRFGNKLFTTFVAMLFGQSFTDILSGYRVFSRRFVKSFPCMSGGFEIETELTVHSLDMKVPVAEVDTPYASRPEGSESKLSTYKDGIRILWMIFMLAKEIKPFLFFSCFLSLLLGDFIWPRHSCDFRLLRDRACGALSDSHSFNWDDDYCVLEFLCRHNLGQCE